MRLLSAGDVRSAVFWHYNWHEMARNFEYGGVAPSALGHYWSLSIEEQYYFVFPLVAMGALRLGGRRALSATVAAMVAAGLVLAVMLDSYFSSFSRMAEIAFGCLARCGGLERSGMWSWGGRSCLPAWSHCVLCSWWSSCRRGTNYRTWQSSSLHSQPWDVSRLPRLSIDCWSRNQWCCWAGTAIRSTSSTGRSSCSSTV